MTNINQIEIQTHNSEDVEQKVYVALVLDESSSMGTILDEAISLFNENLQTMKVEGEKHNIRNIVSIVKFSSDVNVIHKNIDVDEIDEINTESYSPHGMTAMYDGIGTAINILKGTPEYKSDDPNVSYLVLVITDGQENNSKEFEGAKLSEWITELEDSKKWTFTVLGANLDLKDLKDKLGLQINNVADFSADSLGVRQASDRMTQGLQQYFVNRSEGQLSASTFYSNRQTTNSEESSLSVEGTRN